MDDACMAKTGRALPMLHYTTHKVPSLPSGGSTRLPNEMRNRHAQATGPGRPVRVDRYLPSWLVVKQRSGQRRPRTRRAKIAALDRRCPDITQDPEWQSPGLF